MKAKNIFQFGLMALSVAILPSCEDFLDRAPISEATQENAYKTASDAEAALIGGYDTFQAEYYIWDNILFSDVMSDNYYAGGDNPEIFSIEDLTVVPTNGRLFNNWTQIYNGIAKVNVVIQRVPSINDPKIDLDNRRQQILGEAHFLRAYHYFQLVKLWGGVPLVTQPIASTEASETNIPRSSEAEVYAQIIADLEFAVANLPDTYGANATVNKGRATKGAANALLAKVHAQKADRNYTTVLNYCNAVINSPAGYQLLDDFGHLWDGAHYNNQESIMEVQFTGGPEANWGPQLLLPKSLTGDSWRKFVTPSQNLIAAFDAEGDTERKNASFTFEEAQWADEFWSENVGGVIPFAFKWKSANGWASTNRQYLLRLGDIVLLKAEALNELGQLSAAQDELNRIRNRAGLADTDADTKEELSLAIENERRLELCQEGHRWDDLKRSGRAIDVMNDLVEIDLRNDLPKNYDMQPFKLLLPIPQPERARNGKLDQNPGYN